MAVVPSVRKLFPMKAASDLENSGKEPLDILPRDPADWPDSLSDLRGGFADRLNVYRVMAHHPELLLAWKNFRNHVVGAKALGNEYCEVVILRAAHRLGAAYEWAHHVVRGRRAGLNDDRIRRIGGPSDAMSGADAVLVRAVDELVDHSQLTVETQRQLVELVGIPGMFDVIATVGHYIVLGFIVKSFDTVTDTDIADELSKHPFQPDV